MGMLRDIKRRELWTGESNEGVWKIVDREALLFYIYIYIYIYELDSSYI